MAPISGVGSGSISGLWREPVGPDDGVRKLMREALSQSRKISASFSVLLPSHRDRNEVQIETTSNLSGRHPAVHLQGLSLLDEFGHLQCQDWICDCTLARDPQKGETTSLMLGRGLAGRTRIAGKRPPPPSPPPGQQGGCLPS